MSKTKAALKDLTDTLRSRGGVEHGTAKYPLQAHGEEYEWRDYVRGKDLAKYLKGKQELLDEHTKPQGQGRSQDDQIADLMHKVVQAKLMTAAGRKFKKAKPGKKKLVKWPRTLELVDDPTQWSEELFYVFNYDKPTGMMFYVGAALVVLAVFATTLFPLAPHWVKVVVLYLLTTLLFVMLGTILIRYVIFTIVWLLTGASFWVLPNLMSETLPLLELFKPFLDWKPRDPKDKMSSILVRGAAAAVLGGCCWALLVMGPDAKTVKNSMQGAQDSVLRYFDVIDSMKAGITNVSNTTGININTTSSSNTGADSSSSQEGESHGDKAAEELNGDRQGAANREWSDADESSGEDGQGQEGAL